MWFRGFFSLKFYRSKVAISALLCWPGGGGPSVLGAAQVLSLGLADWPGGWLCLGGSHHPAQRLSRACFSPSLNPRPPTLCTGVIKVIEVLQVLLSLTY